MTSFLPGTSSVRFLGGGGRDNVVKAGRMAVAAAATSEPVATLD